MIKKEEYLVVKNVSKYFEHDDGTKLQVLNDINFSIPKGSILCIVGALRAIAGLDPDYEGSITIKEKEVKKPKKERGIVFQEHRLFPWLTVEQNVGYALNNVDKEEKKRLVKEHIELVGLSGFEKVYPKKLSGGMSQRAGIARALVNDPEILLLDEPFGALDTFTKISMQKEMKKIQKKSGTTMILVTHDIDEAVFLGDYIIVLSSRPGRIKRIIEVDLPGKRDRNGYDFLKIRKSIYDEFFEEDKDKLEYSI